MGAVRNIVVRIGADVGAFNQAMQSASSSLAKFGSKMQSLGAGMSLAVSAPLILIGKNMLTMAMDAVESENLFEVSFGGMANSARKFSEDLSQSLGLNAYDVRKNAAMLDAMMKSMGLSENAAYKMSTGLTQLSYDMASFYNLNPQEAFDKIKSGISGEAEPLKALGVLVNETTIKTWALKNGLVAQGQELTEQQKVFARYGAIMEQTKLAQGDLARTMDSPTNKLRVMQERFNQLQIALGQQLIPIFTKVLEVINPLIQKFMELSPSMQKIIVVIGIIAAALPIVVTAIAGVITAIATIGEVLAAIGIEILIPIAAIGALVAAMIYLYNTNENVKNSVQKAWSVLVKYFEFVINYWINIWNSYGVPLLESIMELWNVVIEFIKPIFQAFVDNFKIMYNELAPAVNDTIELFVSIGNAVIQFYETFKPTIKALGAILWVLFGTFISTFGGIVRAIGPFVRSIMNSVNVLVDVFSAATALLGGDIDKAKSNIVGAFNNYNESIDNVIDGVDNFIKGNKDTADAYIKGTMNAMDAFDGAMEKVKAIWAGKGENKLSNLKLGSITFTGGAKLPNIDPSKNVKDMSSSYNTAQIPIEDLTKELKGMGETGQKAIDKLADKIKSFGQAVKQQADSFANFVGLFDKVSSDQTSGERLLARLKGQLKVMELWKKSIEKLQEALGTTSPLFQKLLNQGPSAAFQVAALARLSPEKLQEYNQVYQSKEQIATQMAVPTVLGQYAQERALNQVVINITGNKIDEDIDIDNIANSIVSKLKLQGVLP